MGQGALSGLVGFPDGRDGPETSNGGSMSAREPYVPSGRAGGAVGYMPALDGLRSIAVILVLIYHWLQPVFTGGNIGVDVFFVISGYIITAVLLRELEKTGRIRLRRFYIRRALRLWPALLLMLLVLLIPGLLLSPDKGAFLKETASAALYLTPVTQFVFGDAVAYYHTWTLALEEYFYLLWPIALIAVLRAKWAWKRIVLVATSAGLVLVLAKIALVAAGTESGSYLRVGGLLLGCAAAVYIKNNPGTIAPRWFGSAGIILLLAAAVIGSYIPLNAVAYLLADIASVALVASLVTRRNSKLASALSVRPMVYVGAISYELYLWHYPVLVFGGWATGMAFNQIVWWAGPAGIILAVLCHQLLRPVAALKERF
jgi:peptidoglycan/LPS O-acetylase OafA/YrhL